MATAKAKTMRRLGPSGSLIKKNTILDEMIATMPKIIKEIFFDLKCMFLIIFFVVRKTHSRNNQNIFDINLFLLVCH